MEWHTAVPQTGSASLIPGSQSTGSSTRSGGGLRASEDIALDVHLLSKATGPAVAPDNAEARMNSGSLTHTVHTAFRHFGPATRVILFNRILMATLNSANGQFTFLQRGDRQPVSNATGGLQFVGGTRPDATILVPKRDALSTVDLVQVWHSDLSSSTSSTERLYMVALLNSDEMLTFVIVQVEGGNSSRGWVHAAPRNIFFPASLRTHGVVFFGASLLALGEDGALRRAAFGSTQFDMVFTSGRAGSTLLAVLEDRIVLLSPRQHREPLWSQWSAMNPAEVAVPAAQRLSRKRGVSGRQDTPWTVPSCDRVVHVPINWLDALLASWLALPRKAMDALGGHLGKGFQAWVARWPQSHYHASLGLAHGLAGRVGLLHTAASLAGDCNARSANTGSLAQQPQGRISAHPLTAVDTVLFLADVKATLKRRSDTNGGDNGGAEEPLSGVATVADWLSGALGQLSWSLNNDGRVAPIATLLALCCHLTLDNIPTEFLEQIHEQLFSTPSRVWQSYKLCVNAFLLSPSDTPASGFPRIERFVQNAVDAASSKIPRVLHAHMAGLAASFRGKSAPPVATASSEDDVPVALSAGPASPTMRSKLPNTLGHTALVAGRGDPQAAAAGSTGSVAFYPHAAQAEALLRAKRYGMWPTTSAREDGDSVQQGPPRLPIAAGSAFQGQYETASADGSTAGSRYSGTQSGVTTSFVGDTNVDVQVKGRSADVVAQQDALRADFLRSLAPGTGGEGEDDDGSAPRRRQRLQIQFAEPGANPGPDNGGTTKEDGGSVPVAGLAPPPTVHGGARRRVAASRQERSMAEILQIGFNHFEREEYAEAEVELQQALDRLLRDPQEVNHASTRIAQVAAYRIACCIGSHAPAADAVVALAAMLHMLQLPIAGEHLSLICKCRLREVVTLSLPKTSQAILELWRFSAPEETDTAEFLSLQGDVEALSTKAAAAKAGDDETLYEALSTWSLCLGTFETHVPPEQLAKCSNCMAHYQRRFVAEHMLHQGGAAAASADDDDMDAPCPFCALGVISTVVDGASKKWLSLSLLSRPCVFPWGVFSTAYDLKGKFWFAGGRAMNCYV